MKYVGLFDVLVGVGGLDGVVVFGGYNKVVVCMDVLGFVYGVIFWVYVLCRVFLVGLGVRCVWIFIWLWWKCIIY